MLLGAFAAMGLGVVHLRAEQTRCASRVLRMEGDWIRLRGELWSLQARIARMRSPDRIHDRATYLATGLLPPGVRTAEANMQIEKLAANDSPNRPAPPEGNASKSKPTRRKNPKRE